MKEVAREEFRMATNMLDDLCVLLVDANVTASRTKKLLVLQDQS
ncbi:hypothetical protein [Burkholderia stabilis]|nr:hypothetical protein [Burkholderia stabilis]